MTRLISRLERLAVVVRSAPVLTELRDELIRDLYTEGIPVAELVGITGLTRARIYQLLNMEEGQ